jgi:excisionase family DNA binding protein
MSKRITINKEPNRPIDAYVSATDAAAIVGISKSRILFLIQNGRIPASKIGPNYVVARADAENFKRMPAGRPKSATASPLKSPWSKKTKRVRLVEGRGAEDDD